ncbi:MAG: type II RES/Xre toxin-antitoxin system antitoxin [Nitrosospira sp.]
MTAAKASAAKSGRTGRVTKAGAGPGTACGANRTQADSFAHLLSGKAIAGFEAVNLIREGYPAGILKSTGGFFGVPEARILKIAHVAPATAHRLQKKAARIDSAATERIYRIGKVTLMAIEVFEDDNKAIEWMRQPNPTLANTAPLDLMDTEPGAQSVQQVLNAIATGGVV